MVDENGNPIMEGDPMGGGQYEEDEYGAEDVSFNHIIQI